jgi:hypothetical protein
VVSATRDFLGGIRRRIALDQRPDPIWRSSV